MMARFGWPALVFVLALAIRVAYVVEHHDVLDLDISQLRETDNYVFRTWAETIADGDVLCWNQPHAYHLWTREVAPELRWLEWYGGPQTYHQSPLYAYFLAGVYAAFGREHQTAGLVQAVLGALTCMLTYVLTRRVAGQRAGVIAGLLLAFCGPYFFFDAFLLRDGPMALVTIVTALALDSAVTKRRTIDWLLAGGSLGIFTLAKETGTILLGLALLGIVVAGRRDLRPALKNAALVLAGWAIVTTPVFARNVWVGAPTFKLSTRGPEVFVAGNAEGQDGVGWDPPIELTRRILMDANFGMGKAMLLTLATHRADPFGFPRLLWHKTHAMLNGFEVSNNVNFYLHRAHLKTLELGFVSVTFLGPAALLGMLVGLRRWRRLAVPYLLFLALFASVVLLYVIARFRPQVLPLMALFAAVFVDWAWTCMRQRRFGALVLAGAAFAGLTAWCWPDSDPYNERNRNTGMMMQLVKAGNLEHALRYSDLVLQDLASGATSDEEPEWRVKSLHEGAAALRRALDTPPGAQRELELGRAYTSLMQVTKRGEREELEAMALDAYASALRLDSAIEGAHHGIGRVHAAQSDMRRASRSFRDEIERHPENGEAHRDIAMILMNWGGHDARALEHIEKALADGVEEGAILAYAARLHVDPRLAAQPPLEVRGESITVLDHDRARRYAERALELDPKDNIVREQCSYALYALGDVARSIELLEELIQVQPWRRDELLHRIEKLKEGAASRDAPDAEGNE